MINTTILCQYIKEDDYASMTEFLVNNPNSTLINEMCYIKNLIPLNNGIYADTIFGETVSPLFFAVAKNNEQMSHIIVKLSNLLEIDSTGVYKDTALMVSSLYGNFNITEMLIDNSASVTLVDEHGNTALHKVALRAKFADVTGATCCREDYIEIANLLLNNGANIDAIAHGNGQPDGAPINIAINYRDFNMTEFLLKKGADTTIQDTNGKTALCEITKKFNVDEAKNLIQYSDFTYTYPFCNLIEKDTCQVETNNYQKICNDDLSSKCKEHHSIGGIILLSSLISIAGPACWLFTGLGALIGSVVKISGQCCGINNYYTDNGIVIGALSSATLLSGFIASELLYDKYTDNCTEI
ncbi:ankyrin repeat domain-containing protein [Candidatus Bandiella numerosa]|uniref:ankyrin repeat domain-containing protein n=1 Tax=Candidatus Bandiella numerosa TaxID=2570586 RepID=UPI00249DA54E|nr:ankyrin repeat domain-containing protein [Candidatus Bandiella numerosa]WHA05240.1 ankyrin repeat domain-containing protein [Candidatus Bandiella numerosa]